MKIACSPLSAAAQFQKNGMSQDAYFELVASCGAEASDIMDPESYPWFWQDPQESPAILKRLQQHGLKMGTWSILNNFAKTQPQERQAEIQRVTAAIRRAAESGASMLRIFGGFHQDIARCFHGIDYANGLSFVLQGLEAVLPEAERCGVTLALENHGRLPGLSEEILFVLQAFASPRLGFCMDVGNFLAGNMNETEDPLTAYEKLRGYVRHVHCKDWRRISDGNGGFSLEPTICGSDGFVPLRQMAYRLEKDGFAGYCDLEYEGGREDGIPRGLRYLQSLKEAAALLFPQQRKD